MRAEGRGGQKLSDSGTKGILICLSEDTGGGTCFHTSRPTENHSRIIDNSSELPLSVSVVMGLFLD